MGAILPTLQLGLAYCCCNTTSSLCNTCFGSTDANTSGRKRSVLLLSLSIAFALLFQYSVAPSIVQQTSTWWNLYKRIPGLGKLMYHAWMDGCRDETANDSIVQPFYSQCAGNAGVYRPTCCSTFFFIVSAIATYSNPKLNKAGWPAKYGTFLILVGASMMIPNSFFVGYYIFMARLAAMVFIVLQQVILVDMAYNWNETWLERSDTAERLEWGSGKHWLRAIVGTAIAFYVLSITGIGLLYHYFTGCTVNTVAITMTWIGIVAITVLQLTGTEGSLLTTSVISLYATYLAYSIVSKHPNGQCNPTLGSNDVMGIVVGLFFTMLSLAWTGWSWTAQDRLNLEGMEAPRSMNTHMEGNPDPNHLDLDVPFLNPEDEPTSGVVMDSDSGRRSNGDTSLWKLNIVLALVSCWVAASLTGWGTIQGGFDPNAGDGGEHTAANPMVGRWNMAMIGIAEGLALGLYGWTLVAPRIFPDRDFS